MALELAFESVGDGPPLLILHGLFGSGGNWRSVARALSTSHRVISVDLRNHGGSPWVETMSYLQMADDVRALIEWEQLHLPAVMGHSMGGKTAMALALLYPELLSRLIVVDIAPVCYADRLSMTAEAMRAVDTVAAASRDEPPSVLPPRWRDRPAYGRAGWNELRHWLRTLAAGDVERPVSDAGRRRPERLRR